MLYITRYRANLQYGSKCVWVNVTPYHKHWSAYLSREALLLSINSTVFSSLFENFTLVIPGHTHRETELALVETKR